MISESAEQKNVVRWWGMVHCGLGVPDKRLLFAVPNGGFFGGGRLGAMRGVIMRAEGLTPGIPDLMAAIPRNGFHGLFIEMKRVKGGVLSKDQKEMHNLLTAQGYCVVVCKGFNEAVLAIKDYLSERH